MTLRVALILNIGLILTVSYRSDNIGGLRWAEFKTL